MLKNRLNFIPFNISVLQQAFLPKNAYNPERDQYKSHHFLKLIGDCPGDKVLGICDVDLYSDDYNFVFGQAEISKRSGVISLFRLKGERGIYHNRVVKEATHELGHTLGLTHCKKSRCVMFFSERLEDTDKKEEKFCKRCEKKLQKENV
jgi:archaemetzincin